MLYEQMSFPRKRESSFLNKLYKNLVYNFLCFYHFFLDSRFRGNDIRAMQQYQSNHGMTAKATG
ncbi:hypothetical protein D0Z68_01955 [Rickettsia japonica]|uniref:Peptidoglycan binding-like domain-containing protein n=1 Tax=Rickettsia japonica TaxID=35790 RepID=A0ABM6YFL6_RICJA|nr:hypothetical protein D0Z68_01955 [Rickettsia japonica]